MQGLALAALATVFALPAAAKDVLKIDKADRAATPIILTDVGVGAGIFAKDGIDVQITNFGGGELHQAIAPGSIDIGVGAGPELTLIAKGSSELAICDCYPSMRFIGIAVPEGSLVRRADDEEGSESNAEDLTRARNPPAAKSGKPRPCTARR